jgi:prephenate dehydrogenase
MRVALLGLGLIGGSVARALHADAAGGWSVAAWTPNAVAPRVAEDAGIIRLAAPTPAAAIDAADLVVLAAPPLDCLELVRALGSAWREALASGAVVTDVASTKRMIVAEAERAGLRFVGGHPMAGREASGLAAADASLFRGRPWVIVPPVGRRGDDGGTDEEAVARVEALARACGARSLRMSALEHDRAVAAISHLPLVLSAALVEAVAGRVGDRRADWPAAVAVAAGGWESTTRLARGDVEMGTGIAVTNAAEITGRLRDVRDVIDGWLADLKRAEAEGDEIGVQAIRERLASARAILVDED